MNPYDVLINPLRPTFQSDFRALENGSHGISHGNSIDHVVSQAAYRLANSVDRLLSRRGR